MVLRKFGHLANKQEVQEIILRRGQLTASVLTYGAAIRSLTFEGREIALGFDSIEDYLRYAPDLGAIMSTEEDPDQSPTKMQSWNNWPDLHLWTLEEAAADRVRLSLSVPIGAADKGERAELICQYILMPNNTLRIELEGHSDKEAYFNPRFHGVFNLSPTQELATHCVSIPASGYSSPVSGKAAWLQITDVEGTQYDLRNAHRMSSDAGCPLDVTYYMRLNRLTVPELSAVVQEDTTGTKMEVWSTEPGLVYREGLNVRSGSHCRHPNQPARQGFSIEPQGWPRATEKHEFSNVILKPGEVYKQRTEFRFS